MEASIWIVCILVAAVHHGSVAANQDNRGQTGELEELIMILSNRIEYLETRDNMQEQLIESLRHNSLARDKEQTRTMESLKQQVDSQSGRIASLEKQNIALQKDANIEPVVSNEISASTYADDILQTTQDEKQNTNRIKKGIHLSTRENEEPFAFFAAANAHLSHLGANQVLLFDNTTTNVGNAFHEHIGTFIAPVDGIYVFSATVVSQNHHDGHADFVKNGQFVSRMFVQGSVSGYDSTSKTIVIVLNMGDDVTIRSIDGDASFQGDSHSSFAGFLLQQTFPGSPVIGK